MKKKRMADGLLQSLKEAVEIKAGRVKGKTYTIEIPKAAPSFTSEEIKQIREEIFHLSQPLFATLLNVSLATVRSWEQGQKHPGGPAARLLQILRNGKEEIVEQMEI